MQHLRRSMARIPRLRVESGRLKLVRLPAGQLQPSLLLRRNFGSTWWRQGGARVRSRLASRGARGMATLEGTISRIPTWKFAAAGAIGAVGVFALSGAGAISSVEGPGAFASHVRARLRNVYGYVVAGLAGTAGVAAMLFRMGIAQRLAMMNPWIMLAVGLVGTIGLAMATRAIDYHESPILKHLVWAGFLGLQAVSLCPLAYVGGPLLLKAALATAGVVGSIALVAMAAPSESYLKVAGPLSIGLGLTFAAGIGSMLFPGSAILHTLWLYGGLAVHGGFVYMNTQRIAHAAEVQGPLARYDPINESIGIYIHTLNIFIRMVMMLAGSGRKRK